MAGAGRTVTVEWGTSTLSNGNPVDGYVVRRYDAGTAALQTTLAGCAGSVTATSCVESGVPAGQWKYSVTPVFATNWEGPEGLKSGTATVAAATLSLDETLFGPPLPQSTTGSLTGFAAAEGIGYRLDASTPLAGSPASAGAGGTATITSLSIPSASDGAHTVYALGDASPSPSTASAGIVVDTTAPTVSAELTPAPNAAGWSASTPVQVLLSADDASGSGIDRIRYTTDGSDPLVSGTALDYVSPLSIGATTTVRYFAADLAANASAVQSQLVKIDLTAPVNLLSLSGVSGGAHLAGATVFYRGTDAGSFTLTNALSDPGGSGPASSATAALSGTTTGWSHAASVVALPSGGPYVSASFGWSAGTTSAPAESVTGTDVAGNTHTSNLTFTSDGAGPTGGALSVNGVAATGGGSVSGSVSGGFAIVRTDYGDAGSGLVSSILTLESAALSSSDGVAGGRVRDLRFAERGDRQPGAERVGTRVLSLHADGHRSGRQHDGGGDGRQGRRQRSEHPGAVAVGGDRQRLRHRHHGVHQPAGRQRGQLPDRRDDDRRAVGHREGQLPGVDGLCRRRRR